MLGLVGFHLALALMGDPSRHVFWAVFFLIAAAAAWAVAVRRFEARLGLVSLLGIAALLRAVLLPLPPSLSDDAIRYLWDGRVVAAGANPYLLAPEDDRLAELRDPAWQAMPHKHVPTVYPPLALLVFTAAGKTAAPFLVLKIILVLADLFGCYLLARMAQRLGVPLGRAAWYAWCPLTTLEIAGQGHVDGLMVPLMVLAVFYLAPPQRPARAGVAAAAGALAKLVPLALLPIWARTLVPRPLVPRPAEARSSVARFGPPLILLGAAGAALMLGLLPVVLSVGGVPPGLVAYGVSWEWNGPLYEPLWRMIDAADPVDGIKAGLDRLKQLTGLHDFWNRFYSYIYPQLLAKVLLLGGFALFYLRELRLTADRPPHPVTATGRVTGAILLAAATVYPWYLLWVLPWASLGRRPAWLTLAALMPLTYVPQHGELELFPWLWAAVWLPFFALLWRQGPWTLPPVEPEG